MNDSLLKILDDLTTIENSMTNLIDVLQKSTPSKKKKQVTS